MLDKKCNKIAVLKLIATAEDKRKIDGMVGRK